MVTHFISQKSSDLSEIRKRSLYSSTGKKYDSHNCNGWWKKPTCNFLMTNIK